VWVDASGGAGGNSAEQAAAAGFDGPVQGFTVGSDKDLYVLGSALVRVGADRKAAVVLSHDVATANGLAPLPHGAFATGMSGAVERILGGATTLLAGVAGASSASGPHRAVGQPAPRSAPAAGFHFAAAGPVPFATRPDGSVLIADTDVVWSLKGSRLTRLYQLPTGQELLSYGAVDHAGTAYVAAGSTYLKRAGAITAISTDGRTRTLPLPASIPSVTGDPGDLNVLWLTGDASDGVYVRAEDQHHDYVLHLHDGTARLVARAATDASTGTCHLPHPVRATALPCALPTTMAATPSGLTLGGHAGYVLRVALP
jgi:hypothetical protein